TTGGSRSRGSAATPFLFEAELRVAGQKGTTIHGSGDRKSTRLHSSHTETSTLPLHAALPISRPAAHDPAALPLLRSSSKLSYVSLAKKERQFTVQEIGRAHVCTPVTPRPPLFPSTPLCRSHARRLTIPRLCRYSVPLRS